MKRLFFLVLGVMLVVSPMFAWQYSVSTTWNGSSHQPGSTNFVPTSTTAYMKMAAPDLGAIDWCPSEEPGFDYYARATLSYSTTTHTAERRCGGCAFKTGTVTTTDTWRLSATIQQLQGAQIQAQGPVAASAGSSQQSQCYGS